MDTLAVAPPGWGGITETEYEKLGEELSSESGTRPLPSKLQVGERLLCSESLANDDGITGHLDTMMYVCMYICMYDYLAYM